MGVALGADPGALIEDDDLYAACVKRFLAGGRTAEPRAQPADPNQLG